MSKDLTPEQFKLPADLLDPNLEEEDDKGLEQKKTEQNNHGDESEHDYEKRYKDSSKEAIRLAEELKLEKAENLRLKALAEEGNEREEEDDLETIEKTEDKEPFPGYDALDEEAKNNLIAYTESIKSGVMKDIQKNPAIAFAMKQYNENKFESALKTLVTQYPDLEKTKDEFKAKHFNPNNVPDNIGTIMVDLVKSHLFDKAKDIGAEEERKRADRIDTERAGGGNKEGTTSRTLGDWERMAQTEPMKFARLQKEYEEDMKGGKLKE